MGAADSNTLRAETKHYNIILCSLNAIFHLVDTIGEKNSTGNTTVEFAKAFNATATDLLSCRSATWCKSSSWTKKRKWHTANNAFSWLTNQGNDLSGPCNWKVD